MSISRKPVHTGNEHCPVRPLHDPCHTGSPELPGYAIDAMTARTMLAAWRRQVRGTPAVPDDPYHPLPADGHQLAFELIRKHGTDRYPTPAAQYRKLLDETGELGEAMMAVLQVLAEPGTVADLDAARAHVRKEYGDAGLSLFELGSKLGLSLTTCMTEVVQGETRTFAFPPESGMTEGAS